MSNPQTVSDDASRLDGQMLSDLWVFRWVARYGTVTAAAARLSVTQGAVSQRVSRLEARLGTQLFVRRHNRLILTDAGSGLLVAMNSAARVLNSAVSRFDRIKRRTLVISCMPSLATEWLVPRLPEFYERYPGIELIIRAELVPPSVERFEEESIDVMINYDQHATADLHELASLPELLFPVCSRTYHANHLTGDRWEPIVRLHDVEPWLGGPPYFEWDAWTAADPEWCPEASADRHFNLAQLAYHAALSDQGVAVARAVLVNRLLGLNDLVSARGLPPVPGAAYRILTHRPGNADSPVRNFASWLLEAMHQTQQETLALLDAPLAA